MFEGEWVRGKKLEMRVCVDTGHECDINHRYRYKV